MGEPIGRGEALNSQVFEAASGAFCRLVATGDDEMAGLWDVATGKRVGPPFEHPSLLLALSSPPDGNRLLTCCGDEVARSVKGSAMHHSRLPTKDNAPLELPQIAP